MAKQKTPTASQNPYKGAVKAARAAAEQAQSVKRPSVAATPIDEGREYVRVRFHRADQDGPWSILDVARDEHRRLLDLISELEETEAKQAFTAAKNCKQYDMTDCPNKDATDRLADKYQGLDTLVRFRLDGTTRVYGARERNEFHLLWWDSDHEVWPSTLRNT